MKLFQKETDTYKISAGYEIGPKCLGHLLEHGRPMGFILEYIPDARFAELDDLELCQTELARLHRIGYKHGDIASRDLLITNDNRAILIDFATLNKRENEDELRAGYASLAKVLAPVTVEPCEYPESREEKINDLRWWLDHIMMSRVWDQDVDEEEVEQNLSRLEQLLRETKMETVESKASDDHEARV